MSLPNPNPPAGIFSTADQTRAGATYLPLESVTTDVYIADVFARVLLSQLYCNSGHTPLREAHYVFPVPANASVCSFEARTDDGRRLRGVVKELTEAKADYEDAIREGKMAALLEQVTHDVFAVCLGTIPPRTNVTVVLSYVMNLAPDDQHDTVKFQLPFHVGARYGAPPTSALYHGTAHRARVSITVWVQMASRIMDVSSPSHPGIEHISRDTAHWQHASSVPDDNLACRRWVSLDTFLDKDFLLVVQAIGLGKPHCLAEVLAPGHSSNVRMGCSTTAVALSVVPRFNLPALPLQEYIFLIDRSGSMSDTRIEMAKKALGLLLRMLPAGNASMFNIFSFGGFCSSLWTDSQWYNNATLDEATRHVNMMGADMGGTELLSALKEVLIGRKQGIPTSVFVLTDGDVFNTQETINYVSQTVSSAPNSAPIRIYTLGIGDGASTALCEGIAAAGNGVCAMAVQTEDLVLKSIRLVNAMRVSTVEDLAVDFEVPGQGIITRVVPSKGVSPGVRLITTTILSNHTPTQAVLKGRLSGGSTLNNQVPVLPLSLPLLSIDFGNAHSDLEVPPLLHTIAAHLCILGFERGILQSYDSRFAGLNDHDRQERTKDLIVELGTQYQIASSHTAFVAVDAPNPPRRPPSPPTPPTSTPKPPTSTPKPPAATPNKPPPVTPNGHSPAASPKPRTASPNPSAAAPKLATPKPPTAAPEPPAVAPTASPAAPATPKLAATTPKAPAASVQSPIASPAAPATPKGSTSAPKGPTRPPTPRTDAGDGNKAASGKGSGKKSSRAASHGSRRSGGKGSTRSRSSASARSTASPALPGAWSADTGRRPDFYAYDPPSETAPHEVMIFSGGAQPVICTAPPLPQALIFSWFPRPAFVSRMFRAPRLAEAGAAVAEAGTAALQSVWRDVWAADVVSTAKLLDFSLAQAADGAFTLDAGLASAVGIAEERLRATMPPRAAAGGDGERVWATAVAVAFLRTKYAGQREVWEILEEKAAALGGDMFEELVLEARKLFVQV